jgi:hypothetical protein
MEVLDIGCGSVLLEKSDGSRIKPSNFRRTKEKVMAENTNNTSDEEHKKLQSLANLRDNLIIAIWQTMTEISKLVDIEDMSKEDFEVWSTATQHSAIQSRLD